MEHRRTLIEIETKALELGLSTTKNKQYFVIAKRQNNPEVRKYRYITEFHSDTLKEAMDSFAELSQHLSERTNLRKVMLVMVEDVPEKYLSVWIPKDASGNNIHLIYNFEDGSKTEINALVLDCTK